MSKHVFAVENLIYEYSILDIKKFLGELDDVKTVEVDFKTKTVTVSGGNGDEIERKLMMNSFHVEKLEIDEPVKKRTLFKKNEVKQANTSTPSQPDQVIKNDTEKTEAEPVEELTTNKDETQSKPKKSGLFKKFLGKK